MKQVTFAPRHHQLTNINTWTPDSQWLVFDVRPSGASFTGETIERVNVNSGTVETIYRATQGAHVGVVTVHPTQERYVFIHGPERPDAQWQYDFHHRRGVVAFQGAVENLDAMDITPPYTPGALRGGSHVHVYSPNGQFVSFTYNDHVLHERDPALDLRNVGVAAPYGPVTPQGQHPREYGGSHWCVLVSRTTPAPAPGSDEINRAYEEGWVGNHTLAFIGDTLAENGDKVPELFIVDLPQDEAGWKQPGGAPLAGTATTMLAPPAASAASFDLHPPSPLLGTGERPAPLGARQSPGDGDSLSDARRRRRSAAVAYFPAGGRAAAVDASRVGYPVGV